MSNCDVILVGYGPTSAILANVLGSYGWRVDVFERMAELHDLPRAVHFDGEVMRIFQRHRDRESAGHGYAQCRRQITVSLHRIFRIEFSGLVRGLYVSPART